MTSKLYFILLICISAVLGLCWYPLSRLVDMQIDSSQLLFFSFAAASVVTITCMALQVAQWRKNTLELLIIALTGGASLVLFHYALLQGNPIVAVSLFCIALIAAFFLDRLARGKNLIPTEFLTILSLLLVAITIIFLTSPLNLDWWLVLPVLAGIGFHRLILVNNVAHVEIPVLARLGAIFIASTWLVGMVLIFSPRSAIFPQENAALFSALYGAVILVPVMASIVLMLVKYNLVFLLLWATALLTGNLVGSIVYSGVVTFKGLLLPLILLLLSYGFQINLLKAQSIK